MTITPIHAVTHIPHGNTLPAIVGIIAKVYPERHTGSNEHGEWSFQKGVFRGSDGAEIGIKFCDFAPVDKTWCGIPVMFSASENSKAKSIVVEDYNGKKSVKVNASTVSVVWNPEGIEIPQPQQQGPPAGNHQGPRQGPPQGPPQQHSAPPQQAWQAKQQQGPPQQHSAPQQAAPAATDGLEGYREARRFMTQCAVMWSTCYDAAAAAAWGVYDRHGQIVVGAAVGIMANSFFIEAARRGMIQTMPVVSPSDLPHKGRKVADLMALFDVVRQAAAAAEPDTDPAAQAQGEPALPPRPPVPDKPPGYPSIDDDEIPF